MSAFSLSHRNGRGLSDKVPACRAQTETLLKVQYVAQGHFNMQTRRAGDYTTDLISWQPVLPPAPQQVARIINDCVETKFAYRNSFLFLFTYIFFHILPRELLVISLSVSMPDIRQKELSTRYTQFPSLIGWFKSVDTFSLWASCLFGSVIWLPILVQPNEHLQTLELHILSLI